MKVVLYRENRYAMAAVAATLDEAGALLDNYGFSATALRQASATQGSTVAHVSRLLKGSRRSGRQAFKVRLLDCHTEKSSIRAETLQDRSFFESLDRQLDAQSRDMLKNEETYIVVRLARIPEWRVLRCASRSIGF